MGANIYNRYVWLLDLVSSYNGITFEQIDEKWQSSSLNDDGSPLPKRTLHNHIEAIDNMFNMRIVCKCAGGYKYYVESEGNTSEMNKAMIAHLRLTNALFDNKHSAHISLSGDSTIPFAVKLLDAMDANKMVQLTWQNFEKEILKIEFMPLYITQCSELKKSTWYVLGLAEDSSARAYELNSVLDIATLDKTYERPALTLNEIDELIAHSTTDDTVDDSFGYNITHDKHAQ